MFLEAMGSSEVRNDIFCKYGPGIEIAMEQLSESQIDWISNLPHPLEVSSLECSIVLCHGSPNNINEYAYPDKPVLSVLQSLNQIPDVLIMGHTHYPFIRQVDGCLVINPGSVGQPRNRVPGAHWALLDTKTMTVEPFVEPYDTSDLIEACIKLAPDCPYLREVLTRS
jgi:predicted phosphodiesterase